MVDVSNTLGDSLNLMQYMFLINLTPLKKKWLENGSESGKKGARERLQGSSQIAMGNLIFRVNRHQHWLIGVKAYIIILRIIPIKFASKTVQKQLAPLVPDCLSRYH